MYDQEQQDQGANVHDRLKSNKSGKPGVCSMGGVGRSQGSHRTHNVNATDSGAFKLDHQKSMSQSFAADIASKLIGAKDTKRGVTPEHLLDLREKGRPSKKVYPMPEDPEVLQSDTDSEDDEPLRQVYASSDESTDCGDDSGSDDDHNDYANIAKLINTGVRGGPNKSVIKERR